MQSFGLPLRAMARSISTSPPIPILLKPKQLFSLSKEKRLALLDASWFMPNSSRKPHQEFISKRIPGAQFLDLDELASPHELGLKHMMPRERVFADACENFGIETDSHVVIYDSHGIFSSPRALFMFKSFGHQKSSVLDGGLPAWIADGLPIESGTPILATTTKYATPSLQADAIRTYEEIVENSALDPASNPNTNLVLDARSRGRYLGTDPEPRPGLPSGHIPRSLSLPFTMFLTQNMGPDGIKYTTFLSPADIRKTLEEVIGLEHTNAILNGLLPVTVSCGSGMTAGVLWLGLKLLGVTRISLYDESWTGYATRLAGKIENFYV